MFKLIDWLVIFCWLCGMIAIFVNHEIALALFSFPAGYGAGVVYFKIEDN